MATLASLEPNSVFARNYQVVRLLAAGGMGAVYEVRHIVNGKRWALKVMHPSLAASADGLERFRREAQVDAIIDSAVVVSVIDAGIDEISHIPFLVMEFLVGEDLSQRLIRGERATPAQVVSWLSQVAMGLDKAHGKGVIHRDLKPENLFLTRSDEYGERVKILDFGIAKLVQAANPTSTEGSGTPQFMAPEQTRRGRDIGPWTDVWALGLVAYVLLVGRTYWLSTTIGELYGELLDASDREAPSVRAARYGVTLPLAFDIWFFRCVQNEPTARYQRAGEAVAELAAALGVPLAGSAEARMAAARAYDLGTQKTAEVAVTGPSTLGPSWTGPTAYPEPTGPTSRAPVATQYMPPSGSLSPTLPAQLTPGIQTTGAPIASSAPPESNRALASTTQRSSNKAWIAAAIGAAVLAGGGVAVAVSLQGGNDGAPTKSNPQAAAEKSQKIAVPKVEPTLRQQVEAANPFVQLDGFSLQRYEVSRAIYSMYIESLPREERPHARPLGDWLGEPVAEETAKRPVTWVTWARAQRFCKAIGARLPSSAEFTKASGGENTYPWGSAWPPKTAADLAVGRGTNAEPLNVGTSKLDVTPAGIHDLFANVSEWTSTTDHSLAVIRGGEADQTLAEARTQFNVGIERMTDEGTAPAGHAGDLADSLTGFRCAR